MIGVTVEKSTMKEYSKLIEEVKNYPKNELSGKPRKTYVEALVGGNTQSSPHVNNIVPVTISNNKLTTG